MKQICIIGSIADTSGYSIHCRNLANAINKIIPVRLISQIPQGFERNMSDQEIEMIKRKPTDDEINLIITNPSVWKLHLDRKINWAFLIWEGDKIPKWIIEQGLDKRIDKIFVASNHTKEAIKDEDILKKVFVMSHGVDLNKFYPKEKPNKTVFLINKGWRNLEDRGGTQYALRAYIEEFTDKDDVELILKINPAYGIPDINRMLSLIIPRQTNLPKINIDINSYNYEELVKLYNSANVLIMPTRAEAFGIPGIEAMACGLPVITTNFGGQTDFCNTENGWIIGGELTEVKHEIMYEGTKWLTPDVNELRRIMRNIYNNQSTILNKSEKALETAKNFTWDKTASKITELC